MADTLEHSGLLTLPTELLVYIVTFLTTRDKAKIKCISSRLRGVMEAPSLWSEFLWPYYDSREERCVCNLLKSYGGYIKILSFPDHVPPLDMFQYCVNVLRLDLATHPTAKLGPSELHTAIKYMGKLQKLDVYCCNAPNDLTQILLVCANIEELTIRVQKPYLPIDYIRLKAAVSFFLFKWKEKGFMPSILNIVCYNGLSSLINEVLELWPASNSSLPSGHTGNLRLYSDLKVPLDLFPTLPVLQLHFGQGAKALCVYASKLGLVGLKNDLMILSNCNHGGNIAYKVGLWKGGNNINSHKFNITSINLKSMTDCNFSSSVNFDHSDLDRLAVACPNLQRLDISFTNCLENFQGMCSIAKRCHSLQGLNLLGIHMTDMKNHMQLWEILSDLKLTHLAIELCNIIPFEGNDTNLTTLYRKFLQLKALHLVHDIHFSCLGCKSYDDKHAVLLSHFPSLTCCLLNAVPHRCSDTMKNIVTNCKELKYLRCCYLKTPGMRTHPSLIVSSCNLQQLFIHSTFSHVSDSFMNTISAHGGLVHVLFHVSFISQEGMATLIMNSSNLLTFHVAVCAILQEDPELLLKLASYKLSHLSKDDVKSELKKRFSGKKLFLIDGFDIDKRTRAHHNWEELNLDVTSNLF